MTCLRDGRSHLPEDSPSSWRPPMKFGGNHPRRRKFLLETAIAAPPRHRAFAAAAGDRGAPGTVVAQGLLGRTRGDLFHLALRTNNIFARPHGNLGAEPADWDSSRRRAPPPGLPPGPACGIPRGYTLSLPPWGHLPHGGALASRAHPLPRVRGSAASAPLRTAMGTVGRLPWRRAPVRRSRRWKESSRRGGRQRPQDFAFPCRASWCWLRKSRRLREALASAAEAATNPARGPRPPHVATAFASPALLALKKKLVSRHFPTLYAAGRLILYYDQK